MPETAREYLIHRFRGDAHALRERVSALQSGARIPGPDLATSRQMAAACDEVADMLDAISPRDELSEEMAALGALLPLLEKKASVNATLPPVRAVFAGAATRIREVKRLRHRRSGVHRMRKAMTNWRTTSMTRSMTTSTMTISSRTTSNESEARPARG